jgi:hypothetical protein
MEKKNSPYTNIHLINLLRVCKILLKGYFRSLTVIVVNFAPAAHGRIEGNEAKLERSSDLAAWDYVYNLDYSYISD